MVSLVRYCTLIYHIAILFSKLTFIFVEKKQFLFGGDPGKKNCEDLFLKNFLLVSLVQWGTSKRGQIGTKASLPLLRTTLIISHTLYFI